MWLVKSCPPPKRISSITRLPRLVIPSTGMVLSAPIRSPPPRFGEFHTPLSDPPNLTSIAWHKFESNTTAIFLSVYAANMTYLKGQQNDVSRVPVISDVCSLESLVLATPACVTGPLLLSRYQPVLSRNSSLVLLTTWDRHHTEGRSLSACRRLPLRSLSHFALLQVKVD